MRRARTAVMLALAAAALLLPPSATAASAGLTLASDGSLRVDLTASIPNGSALRAAVDGNFTLLVDLIVANQSQRATILQQIQSAESTPILSAFFGNRDGTVEGSEVTQFEDLLEQEAQLLPSGAIAGTSALGLTLDDRRPDASHLDGVAFANATGPVASATAVPVTTSLSYGFPYEGASHRLALTLNLSPVAVPLGLFTGAVDLSFRTPSGTTITGTAGFDTVRISNDVLGWGSASVGGSFTPATQKVVAVSFGASTPWGDVLLVVPVAAALGSVVFLLYRRRRRRLRPPP